MKNIKPFHRVIAVFLTLNFLTTLLPANMLFANTSGPEAPEAASFEPVDATDMVNLVTGDLSYVLPLLNVPSPEGGYPLALSYHAGIGLDQEASWVGLGWNLNPGAINRSVSGVPDDWHTTKKYSMMYNNLGVSKSISLGISTIGKTPSFATSLNYSSFKATGGEFTHNFGINASVGLFNSNASENRSFSPSIGGYLGSNGVGLSAGVNFVEDISYGGNIGLLQSFEGDGLSANSFAGVSSLGIRTNLSSKGNLSSSLLLGNSTIASSSGNLNTTIHSDASGFAFKFPLPPLGIPATLDFSLNKTKYWAFDASYSIYNGALYAGKTDELFNSVIDYSLTGNDSYELLYESDSGQQISQTNFSSLAYDRYTVSAQGIGGTISPRILEEGTLLMPRNTFRTRTSSNGQYHTPSGSAWYLKPYQSFKNFSKSVDEGNMHFYFDNEYSSYLKIQSGDWSSPSNTIDYPDATEFFTQGKTFEDDTTIDGISYDAYREENQRLRKGRFIETFTNNEIIDLPQSIIKPVATGFNRNATGIPGNGIGALRITALDGKTYYYSLPVYQKEQFSRVANVEDNSEEKFLEQQQFEPYATHWLLTAITGQDYVDNNGNGRLDENDYGYWVRFEYGKWSDGFAWRTPFEGYETNGDTKSYSWGIKEVYYLDKVITRTHTALFIKEVRDDGKSYSTVIGDGSNPNHYHIPFQRGFIEDDDGNWYSQGSHLHIPIPTFPPSNFFSTSDFWFYANLREQKSLRLSKVLLLNNEDAESVSKFTSSDPTPINGGELSADARIRLFEYTGRLIRTEEEMVSPNHTWYGNFYGNVLNSSDIHPSLISKTIKTIDFGYDETYPLARESSNNTGRLTLESLTFHGKEGVQVIPPYRFDYHAKTTPYVKSDMDDWGYFKGQAMNWSLNTITTPLGSVIDIEYENDRYSNEYAKPTTFFDSGLEFKYTGTPSGPKTLMFRNNPEVEQQYQINFRDYFITDEYTEIDVQYVQNTNTNGDSDWRADFATSCKVKRVVDNEVEFELPQTVISPRERLNETCYEKNWVYYDNEYFHVRDETANWFAELNENSCERPRSGRRKARYKIFAQKEPLNASEGGGIRVKEVTLSAPNSSITKTIYNYTNSETGFESGLTSYAPSKKSRVIPYRQELPGPMVIYEHVSVEERDANNKLHSKRSYHFNTPKTLQENANGVLVENAFEIIRLQDDMYADMTVESETVDMRFSRYQVMDYSASIGRLISRTTQNPENQIVQKLENSYLPPDHDYRQGILQETFNSYKRINNHPLPKTYLMTSSTKVKVPNVLTQREVFSNGILQTEVMDGFDFLTGQVNQTSRILSNGNLIKTRMIPAYSKYAQMSSKVELLSNSNMLSQESLTVTELQKDGQWNTIGANIATWKPDQYQFTTYIGEWPNEIPFIQYRNVWRPHKTFTWEGNTDANGFFVNYVGDDDGFDWSTPDAAQPNQWKQLSEITQYNEFSIPLEIMDVNNNYSSTKMGYDNTRTIAVCNAGYTESFYSSAEDDDGQGNYGGGVDKGAAQDTSDAHTGSNALAIASGQDAYVVTVNHEGPADKMFKISLWAKRGNHANTKVNVGGTEIDHNGWEEVIAGDWVQLNFYTAIPNGTQVFVTANGGNTIVDDFRLHPITAYMTSYVYNEWDELTHIINTNNMATQYEYDQARRLKKVYSEVEDFNGPDSGGFKPTYQYDYTYKYLTNQ